MGQQLAFWSLRTNMIDSRNFLKKWTKSMQPIYELMAILFADTLSGCVDR
jgi:hypothetical protein